MHFFVTAVEHHPGIRDDGDVYAYPGIPVVIEIDVVLHLAAGIQFHQPGPGQHFVETRHDLPMVWASAEARGGSHAAPEFVVVSTGPGDERNRRIALQPQRVRPPCSRSQLRGFLCQARGVEVQGKAYEGSGEFHGVSGVSSPLAAGSGAILPIS